MKDKMGFTIIEFTLAAAMAIIVAAASVGLIEMAFTTSQNTIIGLSDIGNMTGADLYLTIYIGTSSFTKIQEGGNRLRLYNFSETETGYFLNTDSGLQFNAGSIEMLFENVSISFSAHKGTSDSATQVKGAFTEPSTLNKIYYCNAAPIETWANTYGEDGIDVLTDMGQTIDKGYILGGNTESWDTSVPFQNDMLVIKTDADGNVGAAFPGTWAKVYKGVLWIDRNDELRSILPFDDGTYVLACDTDSGNYVAGASLLIKIDGNGNTVWARAYTVPGNNKVLRSVKQTTDGGYVLAGKANPKSNGTEFMVIKTYPSGNVHWAKTYGNYLTEDDEDDVLKSIQETPDGGYILGGHTESFGAGLATNFLVIKTDANGNVGASGTWAKTYGGISNEQFGTIKTTPDGGYILAGYTSSFAASGLADFLVIKTDANGNVTWAKTYGTPDIETLYSLELVTGGYVLCGTTSTLIGMPNSMVIKIDFNGNIGPSYPGTWVKTYGGANNDGLFSAQRDINNRGYILGGYTGSFGTGNNDFMVIKTDSSGNVDETDIYQPFYCTVKTHGSDFTLTTNTVTPETRDIVTEVNYYPSNNVPVSSVDPVITVIAP